MTNMSDDTTAIVETSLGQVLGRQTQTSDGFSYYCFQGMRYAKPPIGDLRFKAPQPIEPWTGVYDARKEGNRSVSFTSDGLIIGDEDCLFINVFTPKLPKKGDKLYPVMFWIHGGGFHLGSGNTDLHSPEYLIGEEIVIVSFNYRLGLFGMVMFNDPKIGIPGNAAFKDMVLALKWVQSNIEYFGGDPKNITVWGQSAGGIAAHLLCVSPMAKGLFHKAIIQSGTGFVGFGTVSELGNLGLKFAEYAGVETDDIYVAYECLKSASQEILATAFMKTLEWGRNFFEGIIGPVVENTPYEPRFLEQQPELYYIQKKINACPVIIGANQLDGLVYATKDHIDGHTPPTFTDPAVTTPGEWELPLDSDKCRKYGKQIVDFYYGQETPSKRNIDKFAKYQTDLKYTFRVKRVVQLHCAATSCPIYVYQFALDSPYNLYKKFFGLTTPGVCHGDDLTYLWHTKYSRPFRINSVEEKTKNRLVKMWTNFAKTSDPNPSELNSLINVKWLPADPQKINHLYITKYLVPKNEQPDKARIEFWDKIYEQFYKEKFEEIHGYSISSEALNDVIEQMKLLKHAYLKLENEI